MKTELIKKSPEEYELIVVCEDDKELDKWQQAVTSNLVIEQLMCDSLYGEIGPEKILPHEVFLSDATKTSHKITGFSIDGNSVKIRIKVINRLDLITEGLEDGSMFLKPRMYIDTKGTMHFISIDIVTKT